MRSIFHREMGHIEGLELIERLANFCLEPAGYLRTTETHLDVEASLQLYLSLLLAAGLPA